MNKLIKYAESNIESIYKTREAIRQQEEQECIERLKNTMSEKYGELYDEDEYEFYFCGQEQAKIRGTDLIIMKCGGELSLRKLYSSDSSKNADNLEKFTVAYHELTDAYYRFTTEAYSVNFAGDTFKKIYEAVQLGKKYTEKFRDTLDPSDETLDQVKKDIDYLRCDILAYHDIDYRVFTKDGN